MQFISDQRVLVQCLHVREELPTQFTLIVTSQRQKKRHRPPKKENTQLCRMPEVIWLTRNSEEAYGDPQQGKDILLCSVQEVIWFCWTPESANTHA